MGYLHIENLYRPKAQVILLFKEVYALEKIHGTSAHVSFEFITSGELGHWNIHLFSGEQQSVFEQLFNVPMLIEHAEKHFSKIHKTTIYGEAYGGKCQGMRETYGQNLAFVAFDVKIGDFWLSVPDAEALVKAAGFQFVDYVKVPTDLATLDAERDKPSVQAKRNGITEDKPREGVVLRPLFEFSMNDGSRIIVKHKGEAFKETKSPRPVVDPSKLQVLVEAQAIADEWVTPMRLEHVLQKIEGELDMTKMGIILKAMVEDVTREASGEIINSKEARQAISTKTAKMVKELLQSRIAK